MFKDIVLATVPSRICDCAADKAMSFAQRFEANLYIVHVCGIEEGWGTMEQQIPSGEVSKMKSELEEYYQEKLQGIEKYEIKVVAGAPHTEILRQARKVNSDLIVLGPRTKEHDEVRSRSWNIPTSCLEQVCQKARCPVMITAQESPYGEQPFFNILVATDFTDEAKCAVAYASQLTRQYKANLHLVHVLEKSSAIELASQKEIEKDIQKSKDRLAETYADTLRGLENYSLNVSEGDPGIEILKFARRTKADLILMAHHSKKKDPDTAFMGSTVANVALHADCPVISVNRHFDLRCAIY